MITAFAFVIAAGTGALARTEAGRRWNRHDGVAWGTVVVNIAGSFALGCLHDVGPPLVTILGVGGLGAFTTFSTFARDTVALAETRKAVLCFGYVSITYAGGISAAALGMALA